MAKKEVMKERSFTALDSLIVEIDKAVDEDKDFEGSRSRAIREFIKEGLKKWRLKKEAERRKKADKAKAEYKKRHPDEF